MCEEIRKSKHNTLKINLNFLKFEESVTLSCILDLLVLGVLGPGVGGLIAIK